MGFRSSSYPDDQNASVVLQIWRSHGQVAALSELYRQYKNGFDGHLLAELHRRLLAEVSPRIIIDGIWLSQSSFGGISRVWKNILSTFNLPGMCSPYSPIYFINRGNIHFSKSFLVSLDASPADPFDLPSLNHVASQNEFLCLKYNADIFCSSWITTAGVSTPVCCEISLVHDCLPEHFVSKDPYLMPYRKRWINGSSALLSVSANTYNDLGVFYDLASIRTSWCHLAPQSSFFLPRNLSADNARLREIFSHIGVSSPFVVLPGSGLVGTYKNPEVLAHALTHKSLHSVNLLITGVNSGSIRDSLCSLCPSLTTRIFSAGFSDIELSLIYRASLAVVLPSLIEGFGLPAIEVMACGGIPLIADVYGLREAGSEAALRFNPNDQSQLVAILQMLLDSASREWIVSILSNRTDQRLRRLNPDLIGLALLAECRLAHDAK